MKKNFQDALAALKKAGWSVKLAKRKLIIPKAITSRYPWVPTPLWEFIREIDRVVSRDEKCWLAVVSGEEPEYEETNSVADSIEAFMLAISVRDPAIAEHL
jgi:hypothetical protein